MPGKSVIPPGSNQGPAMEKREQEKSMQRRESRQEKRMSRWDRHSPQESGRTERRRRRSRSRSWEQRDRTSRYGRSRSRSSERSDVSRKRRWEEKPSTPVVSQVCIILCTCMYNVRTCVHTCVYMYIHVGFLLQHYSRALVHALLMEHPASVQCRMVLHDPA